MPLETCKNAFIMKLSNAPKRDYILKLREYISSTLYMFAKINLLQVV